MLFFYDSSEKLRNCFYGSRVKYTGVILFFVILIFSSGCNTNDSEGPFIVETNEMADPRDGQSYQIVKIGEQWWMAENLNYYTPTGSWYYNNDSLRYAETNGRLYLSEFALPKIKSTGNHSNAAQDICPPGWHIPTVEEWEELIYCIRKYELTGDDLKLSEFWPETAHATNKAYFNAVPAGTVYNNGNSFANIRIQTRFLTSTIDETTGGVWGFGFDANSPEIKKMPLGLENGWSIRCVKD